MPSPRLALFAASFALSALPVAGTAEVEPGLTAERKVVVVVWDGMRPDFVTERQTPTLWKLAQEGVTFRHHHSVYPTATNVNGAALATGVYPNRSGLLANREFRPAIDPRRPVDLGDAPVFTKADALTGGKHLASPTIAEIVHGAGRRTAVAGTKSVTLLHDRHGEFTNATVKDLTRFAAVPMPPGLREETIRLLGPFLTDPGKTNDERNRYATRASLRSCGATASQPSRSFG